MQSGVHQRATKTAFKGRSFNYDGTKLRGLTTGLLRNKFYPNYQHHQATRCDEETEPFMTIESDDGTITQPKKTKINPKRFKRMVKARGTRVDTQVSKAIQWIHKHDLSPNLFDLHGALKPDLTEKINDSNTIKQIHRWLANKTIHSRLVFTAMRRLKLVPLATQVIVRNPKLRIGTAVDVVAKDTTTDEIVLIELKAYNVATLHNYCQRLKAPFQQFTDSPLNQAFLQLSATRSLYKRTFSNETCSEKAFVFIVSDKHLQVFKMKRAFIDANIC